VQPPQRKRLRISGLKREAAGSIDLQRELDALLSWLPVVAIAPAEDVDAYLKNLFSPRLWESLTKDEHERLCQAERSFLRIRSASSQEQDPERLRLLVVDWAAVAERFIKRAIEALTGTVSGKPLGDLIYEMRNILRLASDDLHRDDVSRLYLARDALNMLRQLNLLNIQAGKHLTGEPITWEQVVYLHAGLYWALRATLDAAHIPARGTSRH